MPTNTQVQTNIKTTWDSATGVSYSTLTLIPGLSHKDQLEIERPFTTPLGTLLRQEDLRNLFVIPQSNFTVDETTKKIVSFTTPASYTTTYGVVVTIPAISNGNSLIIRRKSISNESLVSWVDGSRLTASQLNLQSKQLLYLTQEILDRLKYEYVTASDVDYNATYNSATQTWVLGIIGIPNLSTVRGYVDTQDSSLNSLITTLNNKVGINLTINGASNTNVITKLNYLEGLLGSQLFSGFPQSSVVIVGNNGVKDYSANFTLTKGSPDVLALTGNQNLTGKLTVQGTSTNDIVSIKNSSGNEVNKIDQYGNISNAAAPTTQPPNPIIGSLYFNTTSSNLTVYTGSGWQSAGTFNAPSNQVTLDTIQNITHEKSFSANTGFGISSNPLTIVDITGPNSVTSFTGTTRLGTTIRGSTAATDYSGIDLTGGTSGSNPKARIAALFEAGGSKLQLGTSNNYTNGITNTGLTIDNTGKVGVLNTAPTYTLDVTGDIRATTNLDVGGTTTLAGNTTLNNDINIMFKDSGGTARNSFTLNSSNIYKIGDISNVITDSDIEFCAKRNFEFISNANEIARFTSTGRLGIGTNNPSTVLHVVTNATANTITQDDGTGSLVIGLNGGGGGSITHTTSGVVNQLTLNATNGIVSNANIQINSANKIITNTIESVGSTLQLQNNTGTNKVGIGTSSPTEKLEVEGNIKTTGGNKIISDTVETPIIQSTGTIQFRQGYTTSQTPDMEIDSNGVVVFAQTPKIGANTILSPESPVLCQAYGTAGNVFKYANSYLTNFDNTNAPLQYIKMGRIVYVCGIMGSNSTTGNHNITYQMDAADLVSAPYNYIVSGLPPSLFPKQHFLCQGFCCGYSDAVNGKVRQRMVISGYVNNNGRIRIGGNFNRGGHLTSGTGLWATGTNFPPQTSAGTMAFYRSTEPLGALQTSQGFKDYLYGTTLSSGTPDQDVGIYFSSGGTGSSAWGPNTQYIIFNFSYIAAS